MHNNKYMCHIHYQKHIWGSMHHIHIHAPPRTYVRIHAPQTHTCTTYTYMHHQIPPENKICLVDLTSVLYERPNQNERFLLNNMFLVHFTEMRSSVKCAVHFTEMPKLAEMCSAFQCAFHWNAQTRWNALRISVKCAALFSNIWWAFGFPSSRGLSTYERPNSFDCLWLFWFGLYEQFSYLPQHRTCVATCAWEPWQLHLYNIFLYHKHLDRLRNRLCFAEKGLIKNCHLV